MDRIVTKIKALLAKAKSTTNEHEAEIFLAKAYELMEKHQLEAGDLERDDPMGETMAYKRADRGGIDWDSHLMFSTAKYYGCKAIRWHIPRKGYWMKLVGRDSARVTAEEMHLYLVATVRRLGREHAKDKSYLNADQWARRIGVALNNRIHELCRQYKPEVNTQAASNAVVTMDQVEAWIKEHYPNLSVIKGIQRTNETARKAAEGIGLNLQTGHSGQKVLG